VFNLTLKLVIYGWRRIELVKEHIETTIGMLRQYKEQSQHAAKMQLAVWNKEKIKTPPLLLTCPPENEEIKRYPMTDMKEIHDSLEKMLVSELKGVIGVVRASAEAVPSIRANMGCGIFPSLFGVKQELFEDKMPWIQEHISKEQLKRMKATDLVISDEFKMGLEHMAFMAEQLEGTGCLVYPMDLQGAVDTAHLVYGDGFFYDLYDDPKFIHHLLDLSCEAIIIGMEECLKVIPGSNEYVAHYNSLVIPRTKGGLKISEDTSTLLSKDHIEEFVLPYLDRILSHFSGGYVHYCGRNQHLFNAVIDNPLVYGINFGNPEMHDMKEVLQRCSHNGKVYYGAIYKDKDDSIEEYFTRLLNASNNGGMCNLLLQYSCKIEERNDVLSAWKRACDRIYYEMN
jgi:hypothetical protein